MKIIEKETLEEVQKELHSFFKEDFHQFKPFDQEILLFCETLSDALFANQKERENPDFVSLGFWLRKAHLHELQKRFCNEHLMRFPRGLVFHFPPANLDVMLVYSWITSLLVGNSNIIRLPSTFSKNADKLHQIIASCLSQKKFEAIAKTTCFIKYGHVEEITEWISTHADARIIWGGDHTVESIRKIPLSALAKDIAFPDRYSFSVIDANKYLRKDVSEKETLALNFFNDVYWFDQSACSSPRLIFWTGSKKNVDEASYIFYEMLQSMIEKRNYQILLGGALLKQTFVYNQALNLRVEKVSRISDELAVIYLEKATFECREHCGQGLLYHIHIQSLDEIIPFVTKKDQTLTSFGFERNELNDFAKKLNGRGITRIVPFGQALNFDPLWDGQDLFYELTKFNFIEGVF